MILCADILEHLTDPWTVLKLLAQRLAPGGRAAISVPNVGFLRTRLVLARGRFEYSEAGGTFDIGHLRFFTLASTRGLVGSAGLHIWRKIHLLWVLRGQRLSRAPLVRTIAQAVNVPPRQLGANFLPGLLSVGMAIAAGSEALNRPQARRSLRRPNLAVVSSQAVQRIGDSR